MHLFELGIRLLYRKSGLILSACAIIVLSACSNSETEHKNINPEDYIYQQPLDLNDDIDVASASSENFSEHRLTIMIKSVLMGNHEKIDSLLIAKNNKLVLEEYFNGYTQKSPHQLASVTKSVSSLITGIAIEQGYIESIDQKVNYFFPQYDNFKNWHPYKDDITIKHILDMSAGWDCNNHRDNKAAGHLGKMGRHEDWYKFTLDLELINRPGEVFDYCNGSSNLLGGIIKAATRLDIRTYADQTLFKSLSINNYRWFTDPSGNQSTYSNLHLTTRDMLKLGLLFLNNGVWNDEQVVPSDWISKSSEKTFRHYGLLWWKRTFRYGFNEYPELEAIYADGSGGQRIFIIPDQKLVFVTTGSNYDDSWGEYQPIALMFDFIIPALFNNESEPQ